MPQNFTIPLPTGRRGAPQTARVVRLADVPAGHAVRAQLSPLDCPVVSLGGKRVRVVVLRGLGVRAQTVDSVVDLTRAAAARCRTNNYRCTARLDKAAHRKGKLGPSDIRRVLSAVRMIQKHSNAVRTAARRLTAKGVSHA